jgi:hypothetical protein
MATAGTRLRKAVKYPDSDNGSDSEQTGTTGLDEQQQEELISSLTQDDADTINTYRVCQLSSQGCHFGLSDSSGLTNHHRKH